MQQISCHDQIPVHSIFSAAITLAIEWLTPTAQGPSTSSQLKEISTQLEQITMQLNDVDTQVTALLNYVSAGQARVSHGRLCQI